MKRAFLALFSLFSSIAPRCPAQRLVKAYGRSDADIYASATLVGASNASTIYAFDIKYAYRYVSWPMGQSDWLFRVRPLAEFVTNKGTRSSPDKVHLGGEVAFARTLTRSAGARGLRKLKPTEVSLVLNPRGEFDRGFGTRNFVAASFVRLLVPTLPGPKPAVLNLAPMLELGLESGRNFSNRLQPDGSGAIARIYGGLSGRIWHRRLEPRSAFVEFRYQYRGPRRNEIFTQQTESPAIRYLSLKPRHYAEIGLTVPVGNYFGLKPQYKWGSLPPAFSFLDHQYTLSLEVSAKR